MTTTEAAVPVPPVRRKVGVLLGIGILFLPIVFAWVTLRQGYSVVARVVALAWLMLGVGVFFAVEGRPHLVTPDAATAGDAAQPQAAASPDTTTTAAVATAPAAPAQPTLDLATYMRIKTGMSYDAVRALVGADGVEQSDSDMMGVHTVSYTWTNSDGSNMDLMFQQNRLAMKSQTGLR